MMNILVILFLTLCSSISQSFSPSLKPDGGSLTDGGNKAHSEFVKMGDEVLTFLEKHPLGKKIAFEEGIDVSFLVRDWNRKKHSKIVFTKERPVDSGIENSNVDGKYDKEKKQLILFEPHWDKWIQDKKKYNPYHLVFKEILRLSEVYDGKAHWLVSNRLINFLEMSKRAQQLYICGVNYNTKLYPYLVRLASFFVAENFPVRYSNETYGPRKILYFEGFAMNLNISAGNISAQLEGAKNGLFKYHVGDIYSLPDNKSFPDFYLNCKEFGNPDFYLVSKEKNNHRPTVIIEDIPFYLLLRNTHLLDNESDKWMEKVENGHSCIQGDLEKFVSTYKKKIQRSIASASDKTQWKINVFKSKIIDHGLSAEINTSYFFDGKIHKKQFTASLCHK